MCSVFIALLLLLLGGRNDHYRGGYGADRGSGYRSDRDRNNSSHGGYQMPGRDRYGDASSSYRGRDVSDCN